MKTFNVDGHEVRVSLDLNPHTYKRELVTSVSINDKTYSTAISENIYEAYDKANLYTATLFFNTMKQLA